MNRGFERFKRDLLFSESRTFGTRQVLLCGDSSAIGMSGFHVAKHAQGYSNS